MKKMLFTILQVCSFSLYAMTGEEIIRMVQDHNKGATSEESSITLLIKDGEKTIAERKMKSKGIESDGEVSSKLLIEFLHPADVKGTKLLTWTYTKESKAQWIYLPSLKKSRRILAGNKNSSFMGSEFTYEDIGGQAIDQFDYKLVSEVKDGNDVIWTIEEKAKDTSNKDYKIVKIKKSVMSPVAIDYYNARGEKIKESNIQELKRYKINGKDIYRPHYISMKNLVTGKESVLTWEQREFGKKIGEKEFNSNSLDR